MKVFTQKPISPENRQWLKESQCGFVNKKPYVCCSKNSEAATISTPQIVTISKPEIEALQQSEWLKELRRKVPQPPDCGRDASDRIFGGIHAEIDEHPWTVLLEFLKCSLIKFICFLAELFFFDFSQQYEGTSLWWKCNQQSICYNW